MSSSVLIVDDSLTVRMDLGDAFQAAGFSPTLASTVAEAKRALEQRPYALVIIDVMLPDGDGLDLLREVKTSWPSTPVMLLSAEAEVAARLRGLRTGADEYVGKPYDMSYVLARARQLIRLVSPRGENGSQILIVDDSLTFREQLRETLEGAGYSVLLSESGEEALHMAVDARPAAIVVDGILPGIDGPTFIRRVREDALLRRTPCILLTASEGKGEVFALDSGADAYMQKDASAELVLARIGAVLRPRSGAQSSSHNASLHGPKKILAVDDSMTYLQEIGAQLRRDGYDVVLASSGEEALALLAGSEVDCILLDVLMPGLSGYETCRRIKNDPRWRDVPLIMHTARDEQGSMIDGINAGADDYVTKSADFQVLRARLRAQLRRRQFEDESRDLRESQLQKELEAAESRAQRELADTRAQLLSELQDKNSALLTAQTHLEQQNLRVQAASRLKSEFLANMSHELRSPLNAILGFAELLYDGHVKPESPQHKEFLGHILTSGKHLLQLINDVLDLSKVEAGKIELRPETVDPARIIGEVVAVLRATAAQTRNTLSTDLDPSIDRIVVDAARLKQIIYNYVSNALKFTPAGGHVTVRLKPDGEANLCLEVEDTGIGISPSDIDKLFVEFQQLDTGTTRKFAGTGLGLAVTKRIVEAHGGRVGVRSVVGEGSTFYAILPRVTLESAT
ncbi:MAG: response regulator [Polyangia bacterium]